MFFRTTRTGKRQLVAYFNSLRNRYFKIQQENFYSVDTNNLETIMEKILPE